MARLSSPCRALHIHFRDRRTWVCGRRCAVGPPCSRGERFLRRCHEAKNSTPAAGARRSMAFKAGPRTTSPSYPPRASASHREIQPILIATAPLSNDAKTVGHASAPPMSASTTGRSFDGWHRQRRLLMVHGIWAPHRLARRPACHCHLGLVSQWAPPNKGASPGPPSVCWVRLQAPGEAWSAVISHWFRRRTNLGRPSLFGGHDGWPGELSTPSPCPRCWRVRRRAAAAGCYPCMDGIMTHNWRRGRWLACWIDLQVPFAAITRRATPVERRRATEVQALRETPAMEELERQPAEWQSSQSPGTNPPAWAKLGRQAQLDRGTWISCFAVRPDRRPCTVRVNPGAPGSKTGIQSAGKAHLQT
jgi:hypothetical protein